MAQVTSPGGAFMRSNANDVVLKRPIFVFDIETIANKQFKLIEIAEKGIKKGLVDPKVIEKHKEKAVEEMALSPLTGQVILIGMAVSNLEAFPEGISKYFSPVTTENYSFCQLDWFTSGSESELLAVFWKILDMAIIQGYLIGSYCGKKFDLPYLIKRSAFLGIDLGLTTINFKNLLYKYSNDEHADLFNVLGEEGKLAEYAYGLGISNQLDISGSEIQGWYDTQQYNMIKGKNYEDIYATIKILEMMRQFI